MSGLDPVVARRLGALPEHLRWEAWERALARIADDPVVRRARTARVVGLVAATLAGGVAGDAAALGALGVFFGFVVAALLAGALSTPPWRSWLRRRAAPHVATALDAMGAPRVLPPAGPVASGTAGAGVARAAEADRP